MRNKRLTSGVLNASLKSSFDLPLTLVPTYTPALNALMNAVGDKTLKAEFAGNDNFKPAVPKTVTLKVVADEATLGKEAMMDGRAWVGPSTTADKNLLADWNSDNSPTGNKARANKVMTEVQDLTGDEFIDHLNKVINPTDGSTPGSFVPGSSSNPYRSDIWVLSDGLQVRYKPNGDGRPGSSGDPMYCIEGKTCTGASGGRSDVAFKVTSSGKPGAYGKNETIIPPGISTNTSSAEYRNYMDAACGTTHLKCKAKVEQTITWTNPPDLTIGDSLGDASLKPTAQDPRRWNSSTGPTIPSRRTRSCPWARTRSCASRARRPNAISPGSRRGSQDQREQEGSEDHLEPARRDLCRHQARRQQRAQGPGGR